MKIAREIKMIKHIVIWPMKTDVSGEQKEEMRHRLEALKGVVEGGFQRRMNRPAPTLRRRPRVVVMSGGGTAPRPPGLEPESAEEADFISRQVDPILDKISAHGIQSLTEQERQILELARNRIRKG